MIAEAQYAFVDTVMKAPTVASARLPMVAGAISDPWTSAPELTRMLTEKSEATTQSSRALATATTALQTAGEANMRDLGKLAGGGIFWPSDYLRIAERNFSAFAAMVAAPGNAVAPIHQRVDANARRLSS